jgi:hypothetical protein
LSLRNARLRSAEKIRDCRGNESAYNGRNGLAGWEIEDFVLSFVMGVISAGDFAPLSLPSKTRFPGNGNSRCGDSVRTGLDWA